MTYEQHDNQDLDARLETYRIPGTNIIRWSKYLRENESHEPPRFKLGDVVAYLVIGEITRVYEDCDGTPLIEIDNQYSGINQDNVRLATDEEKEDY
jgi:hypothetical protein